MLKPFIFQVKAKKEEVDSSVGIFQSLLASRHMIHVVQTSLRLIFSDNQRGGGLDCLFLEK